MNFRFATLIVILILAILPFSGAESGVECKIRLTLIDGGDIRISVSEATFDAITIVQTLPSKRTYFVHDSVREIVEGKVSGNTDFMTSSDEYLEWEGHVRSEMASLAPNEQSYEFVVSVTEDGYVTGVYSTEIAPIWEVVEARGEVNWMSGFDNMTWVIFEQTTRSETVSILVTSGDLVPSDFQVMVWDGDTLLDC